MSDTLRKVVRLAAPLFVIALAVTGCATEEDGDEDTESTSDELRARDGVNGDSCKRSAYNCSLRAGGQRAETAAGGEDWAIDDAWLTAKGFVDPATKKPVTPVVDGNGDEMGRTTMKKFTMNYGQLRSIKGATYVYAMSTGLKSSGWIQLDAFGGRTSLRAAVGNVEAKGDNLKKLGCYEVATSYAKRLDTLKVVKGAKLGEAKEPNDYLPQVRANGKVYGTLSFNAPGDALGGANLDIFPAGTKFQRLDVPTWESPDLPSLDVKLYSQDKGKKTFTTPAGEMKFVYGYVRSQTNEIRYGWMAIDGLDTSTACDAR